MSPLEISVVIATRSRIEMLSQCLAALLTTFSRAPRLEILVGINGPDDATRKWLQDFSESTILPLRWFQVERVSPAEMRNRLAEESRGQWIVFLDDDARVALNYWEAFEEARRRFPNADVIGGPNLTPPEATRFESISGDVLARKFGSWFSHSRYGGVGEIRSCGEESLILCNLAIRREVLPPWPFPAHLVCAEENWLLQSLTGKTLIYSPHLRVYHHRRSGPTALARQLFRYGWGRGQMLRARPRTFRWPHLVPSIFLVYISTLAALEAWGGWVPFWAWIPLGIYFVAAVVSTVNGRFSLRQSTRRSTLIAGLLEWLLYPVVHISYGAGLVWGLVRR